MKFEDLSEAELEALYRRALKEGSKDRQGETMAGIVRRHFGEVSPDEGGIDHPEPSIWCSDLAPPAPDEIRALRGARSQEEMALLAGLASPDRWSELERGTRRLHWAHWELLLLRMDKHPTLRLAVRQVP